MIGAGEPRPQLVWDWPLRLFHWLLVIAVIALFVTGKLGGNWMEWHKRTGYFALGLIAFRLLWGFVGGYHARFVNFVRGPATILAYVRTGVANTAGHNPLGAVSVLAMLLVLGLQAISGLFSNDDIMLEGPYAAMIGKEMSDLLTKLHKLNGDVILVLVGLHVAAVVFWSAIKKKTMIAPMFSGRKNATEPVQQIKLPAWRAPLAMAAVAAMIYFLLKR
jgi:cytochrome b